LRKRLDSSWVDDADLLLEAMKVQCERFPIRARCLHANVHVGGMTITKPRR